MQKIFSDEEMRDRIIFTMFLNEHFLIRQKGTTSFRYALPIEIIFRLYTSLYPDTILSEADLRMYFTIVGAAKDDHVYLDLRAKHYGEIPEELFKRLESHLTIATLRSLDLTTRPASTTDPAILAFLEYLRLFAHIKRGGERVKLARFHSLYALYCMQNSIEPASNKRFKQLVIQYVGPVRRGYAEKTSGTNYVIATIPEDSEWEASLKLGIGIFHSHDDWFDNLGKKLLLNEKTMYPDEPFVQKYVTDRIKGGLSLVKEKEEEKETETKYADYWRTLKSTETYVEGREEGDIQSTDSSHEDIEGPKEGEITLSSKNESSEAGIEPKRGEATISRSGTDETAIDEHSEGLDGDGTGGEYIDDYEEESITLKEIFSALEVAYRINPTSFDKKTMNSYLVSMDVDFAAADIWEEFMKHIGKGVESN